MQVRVVTIANEPRPGLGVAIRRAATLAAVCVMLTSTAVDAEQDAEQERRRRQIPVRMARPGESARSPRPAPGRNIPVRMVPRGETGPVALPLPPQTAAAETPGPSADRSNGVGTAPGTDVGTVLGSAADPPIDGKRSTATWTDTPPVLDGRIDDAVWLLADVVSDFMQKEPIVGPPTTRTEVRVLYDDDTFYIGWINHDEEPDKIIGTEMRRDAYPSADDWAVAYIDTFHDHRNAFGFLVNPVGTKFDFTLRDETQFNMNWDERWEAAASITERGWEAELAIPFAALRYPTGSNVWGIEFEREIARTRERINWNNTSRDYDFQRVSQYGHLVGLQNLALTDRFRLKPFVTGGYDSFQQLDDPISKGRGDIGIEVFKVQLTPSLTANLTLNTDFAEVQADTQQVNLTRFSLFFPEQREFFLEAANSFTFGAGVGDGGRREASDPSEDGLGPAGQPVPIRFGGKLTGKIGSGNVGFVNVQTSDSQFGVGQNFSAFRWKQPVTNRSTVGALVTNVQGPDGQYNRVFGVDIDFTLFNHLFLTGFVAGGQDNDVDGTSWAGQFSAGWDTEAWGLGGDITYIADDFDTDLGFVLRRDIVRTSAQGRWSIRPSWPLLRRVSLSPSLERITDTSGRLVSRLGSLNSLLILNSNDIVRFSIKRNYELLDFDFPIDENISIPIGDYSWTDGEITLRTAPRRALSGNLTFNLGEFYDGTRLGVGGGPSFRFSDRFTLNPQYNFNRISLPGGTFNTHLVRLRGNLSFSDRLLFDSLLQHSSVTDQLSAFVRLRYIYRTGDDFYLVYRQSTAFSGLFDRMDDRTLTAKFTFTMQR